MMSNLFQFNLVIIYFNLIPPSPPTIHLHLIANKTYRPWVDSSYICHVTILDFLYQGILLISTHTNTVYVVD